MFEFEVLIVCAIEVWLFDIYLVHMQDLVEHEAPNRLPISLNTLKNLHLSDMYFEKVQESSCAICFIRSCPNLQRLNITVSCNIRIHSFETEMPV